MLVFVSFSLVLLYVNLSGKLIDFYFDFWNNVNDFQGVDLQLVSVLEVFFFDLVYLLQYVYCLEFVDMEYVVRLRMRIMC